MNHDITPGPPEGQEPIDKLFGDVFELAEETARRMTDAEVDARLDRLLSKTGHTAPPAPGPDPAWILDAARRQAGGIVADAQRAAAETEAEAAFAAQAAGEAARCRAERIIAEAEEYSDAALRRAAAIIADSRGRAAVIAESIIADARDQADQIVTEARFRAARPGSGERHLALTGTGMCPGTGRVLKMSLDAPPDQEPAGWARRRWSSMRAWMQLGSGCALARWLVIARTDDGVVARIYCAGVIPDDEAHVPDFRWLISCGCPSGAIGEDQRAGHVEELAGILGNVTARSIEPSGQPAQVTGSHREQAR